MLLLVHSHLDIPEYHLVIPWIPLIILLITIMTMILYFSNLSVCVLCLSVYSVNVNPITLSYTTNRHMSPQGVEDLVLHRLQPHVTQPADMATCCSLCFLSSSPFLNNVVIISSLAKTRITRTSSKNIMPVLDTGHLLAFPSDMLDTGEGGEGREGDSFRLGLKRSCEEGEERRRRDDLTTCSIHKALFFCAGSLPWTASPGHTQSPRWAMLQSTVIVICRSAQSGSSV